MVLHEFRTHRHTYLAHNLLSIYTVVCFSVRETDYKFCEEDCGFSFKSMRRIIGILSVIPSGGRAILKFICHGSSISRFKNFQKFKLLLFANSPKLKFDQKPITKQLLTYKPVTTPKRMRVLKKTNLLAYRTTGLYEQACDFCARSAL